MKRAVLTLLSPLLTSLYLCAGCVGDPAPTPGVMFNACAPLAIVVEPSLTAEQAAGLAGGLAMWNQLAGTELVSTVAGEPPSDPGDPDSTVDPAATPGVAPAPAPRVPLIFQVAAPPFHGFFDNQAGIVFINQDLTLVDPLRITIAHEIGHAFGLPHVDPAVRRSLMNSGNTTVAATPEDADALAALWGRCAR